jgi:ABC-2 type transport system ATP-binding protein
MAICGRPQLLFLDEPTVGLDVQARERMWFTLRELVRRGTSIVLTTHYLEEAEALCGRVAMLKAGHIVALDTTQAIMARFGGGDLEEAFVHIMHDDTIRDDTRPEVGQTPALEVER